MELSREDLHYIAGVFDARAKPHLIAGKNAIRPSLTVVLSSVPGPVADYLREKIDAGYTIRPYLYIYNRRPCREHCPEPHVHQQYKVQNLQWRMCGSSAAIVLSSVQPLMLSWDHEWQRCLDFEMSFAANWKAKRVRRMEELGWDVSMVMSRG